MDQSTGSGPDAARPSVTYETYEIQETYRNRKRHTEPYRNQGDGVQNFTTKELKPKPFHEYLCLAVETAIRDYRDRRATGKWSTPCFWLVRLLKAHPELGPMAAQDVITKIEKTIHEWELYHEWPEGFWQRFFLTNRYAAHAEILDIWDQIKRLPGHDALENAAEFSRQHPLSLDDARSEKRGRNPKYLEFVSLCAWLQLTVQPDPIAIPCREFAAALGIDAMTISRFRKWALQDGLMIPFEKHEFHGVGSKSNKASTFRFRADLWPCLQERGAKTPPHLGS